MKKVITATLLGGAIVGSLLGAGAANAIGGVDDAMYGSARTSSRATIRTRWWATAWAPMSSARRHLRHRRRPDGHRDRRWDGPHRLMTIPKTAKFVESNDLVLTPM